MKFGECVNCGQNVKVLNILELCETCMVIPFPYNKCGCDNEKSHPHQNPHKTHK